MITNNTQKILTMGTINNRHRWFQSPLLLPAIVFVAGIFWLAELGKLGRMTGPMCLVLIAQAVLFMFLLQRPVWVVASLIVGQLTASNYQLPLGGTLISLRLIWGVLALLVLMVMLFKNGMLKLGGRAWRIILPAVILFIVATIANYVNTDMSITLQYLRVNITSLIILLLIPAVVENEKDLKRLALVALITCSVSALVALSQRVSLNVPIIHLEVYQSAVTYGRVIGLSESSIQLAYNLPMAMLPMAAIYFWGDLNSRAKKWLIWLGIAMLIALFFTYTRSGLYSLALGLLLIGFLMKGKLRIRFFLVMLILFAAFMLFVNKTETRYSNSFGDDSSSTGRLVLWQAALKIALDHPVLGIGASQFSDVAPDYASSIDTNPWGKQDLSGVLGYLAIHDDFLTIWSSFGTVAMLIFMWIFIVMLLNFVESYRKSPTPFLRGLSLGCFAAVIAYIVNAATHNVMGSSMLMWIMGGLSITTVKIASSKRLPLKVKEIQ
jgi:O-antigen ligase